MTRKSSQAFLAPLSYWVLLAAVTLSGAGSLSGAEPVRFDRLEREFQSEIRPLAKKYCLDCHATAKPEGELDLERFADLNLIRRHTNVWLKVAEMLDNREMPPQDAPQPSAVERQRLRSWIEAYLNAEAQARAGDPGPVVLRKLNNAEYTYTIRDLTGVPLDPAREFPTDSAAGEGFTNTGNSLVMSPAMFTKYLDAAKQIAARAVLLPEGFRFSESADRGDWTNECLQRIRALYAEHADTTGGSRVNLQGIVFDTNTGGRLPTEAYLKALLEEWRELSAGKKEVAQVARARQLNPRYLGTLWSAFNQPSPSLVLDRLRRRLLHSPPPAAQELAAEVERWQAALTRFQSVGHMKSWMVAANPLVTSQELRFAVPAPKQESGGSPTEIGMFVVVGTAGDGSEHDHVILQRPRLVAPGRPDLLLRDVRIFSRDMAARREKLFASTARALNAAADLWQAEAAGANASLNELRELARRHDVDLDLLQAWLRFLGIGTGVTPQLDRFTDKVIKGSNYDFINGWGRSETPLVLANSSDQHVRVPGNMKPHAFCVHPSPTLQVCVGWRSPVATEVRIEGKVTHAHPECGNGVTWALEFRRGTTRQRLAEGVSHGSQGVSFGPIENWHVQPGDLLSLVVGPRERNHSCDLTDVEFTLQTTRGEKREWSLTRDVSPDVLAGNPHADRHGNADVWHFYQEPVGGESSGSVVPAGSRLARWQAAENDEQRQRVAQEVQDLLRNGPPADAAHPDAVLYRQLASLGGPLFVHLANVMQPAGPAADSAQQAPASDNRNDGVGLDPRLFGSHPSGGTVDAASLCLRAPATVEFRLPADLAAGAELVTTAMIDPRSARDGSVQVEIGTGKPTPDTGLRSDLPVLIAEASESRARFEQAFEEFRRLFPAALCYSKIVPVDEVVTLTLFHREDEPLYRLMLDAAQQRRLDQLWEELHFVSHDAPALVDAFEQLMEYATQDSNPKLFEPFRKPIYDRAEAFRRALTDAEPRQLEALLRFAARAYRRPLTEREAEDLRDLYRALRRQELPHDEAFRFVLARILVAPAFLYRLETPPDSQSPGPISDWELATRLSYFLWSSAPDDRLRELAAAGQLRDPDKLAAEARRMLADDRIRRLATEFGCQWLHVYDFASLDEKSERHFPTFGALRADMYEETIRFFTDLFQHDRSVLDLFRADYVIVNDKLAAHYGITRPAPNANAAPASPEAQDAAEWFRFEGAGRFGRGGILGLASTLAKQSGASRTSPILRGNWVSEVLLGEKLPRPPKDVPQLPEDETATEELTVRQLTEKHSSDPRCAACHVRVDPLGFALEGYDAIGRRRERDLANRPIDARTRLQDGTEIDGWSGLRDYLVTTRRNVLVRQFSRKLLGYALGRSVQLSDYPLLDQMERELAENDFRFSLAVETIVRSRQFREIRGSQFPMETSDE